MDTAKKMQQQVVLNIVQVSLFASFIVLGAWVSFPIWIVPISLQDFFVVVAGIFLGSRYGTYAVAVYLLAGAIGLPVFARGASGIGVLIGPTGGYLISFLVGALIAGLISVRNKKSKDTGFSWVAVVLACFFAHIVILGIGVVRLSYVLDKSAIESMSIGVFPFIPGTLIKIVIEVASYKFISKLSMRFIR